MSLSWLDRLTLVVHPYRCTLESCSWRGSNARHEAEVPAATAGESDWQPALIAAAGLLQAAPRFASLHIVVADHFVRYVLLPWSDADSRPATRRAMAGALLAHSLGDKAQALEIAIDRPDFGKNGMAAGIDRALLTGLRTAARQKHLRLESLQPRLVTEWAARRRTLGAGWFACVDDSWLALAGLDQHGNLHCLRNHRFASGEARNLPSELAGLLAAEGHQPAGGKLFIAHRMPAALPSAIGNWPATCWPMSAGAIIHA